MKMLQQKLAFRRVMNFRDTTVEKYVPAEVFSSIKEYYMRQGNSSMMATAIWVMCGPKASCDSDLEYPYYAVIQDGFYTEKGEN